MTDDQQPYEIALRAWLKRQGHTLVTASSDQLLKKLDAARQSDLCLVVLGPTFGPRDPLSSFSHTELETSAAADIHPGRVLVFAQVDAEQSISPEQHEFIDRLRNFVGGTFQTTCHNPTELIVQVNDALVAWQPPKPSEPQRPLEVPRGAAMIRSTGDLLGERQAVRTILEKRQIPVIDYLHAPGESVAPIDRVISWARECQVLLLILGSRYGYISPVDGLGVTELEFVTALRADRPILAFIDQGAKTTKDIDQRQFVERVHALVPPERIFPFTDLNDLKHLVNVGLDQLNRGTSISHMPEISVDLAHRWYRRLLQRWLGTLPHLTQSKGMSLEKVYVSLQIRPREQQQDPAAKESGRVYAEQREQRQLPQSIEVDEALHRYPRLVLRGGPGAGKSIVLRWYAITAPDEITPVYIRLASYARARQQGQVSTLLDAITREEERLILTPVGNRSSWCAALEKGQGLVLLDGLDEVPSGLHATIVTDIQSLATRLPEATRIVVTTRIIGFNTQLEPRFHVAGVQPLNMYQQQQLAEQWLRSAHGDTLEEQVVAHTRARRLITLLERESRLAEWARAPLLLTFLAALADTPEADLQTLPTTKAVIYQRVLRLILGRWGIFNLRQGSRHLWAKEQVLLELTQRRLLEDRGEILSSEDVKHAYEALPSSERDVTTSAGLLRELNEQDGLLIWLNEGQYSFLHPTFQEYLATTLVAALPGAEAEQEITRLIERVNEPFCHQVILEFAQLAHLEERALEDYLYRNVIARLGSSKMEMLVAQRERRPNPPSASAIAWGIDDILQILVDLWGTRLCTTLEIGSPDRPEEGEVASTIASVFERNLRQFAVPALIAGMYTYRKKGRFIGALGKIGTEQAKSALLAFTQEQIAHPGDRFVFRFLAAALGEARVEQAIPLLQVIRDGSDYDDEARYEARRALWLLGQEKNFEETRHYRREEILTALSLVDEEGRPSDWSLVARMATWLQHSGSHDQLVQTYLADIVSALEQALGHMHDGARKPVTIALGELGNFQTFEALAKRLAERIEPSYDVAREMLSSLTRLAERGQIDVTAREWIIETFSSIRLTYPALEEAIKETELRIREYLEEKGMLHEHEEN
jgi:hypothetical protein